MFAKRLLPLFLLISATCIVLAACGDHPETPAGVDVDSASAARGQALEGSCEGACGERSADGCWCDDLCTSYGDCCQDYAPVCLEPEPDPCEDVVCDAPPADSCGDDGLLHTWSDQGTCEEGDCIYERTETVCSAGCRSGACQVCTFDAAFASIYGQAWSPDNVAFVASDGTVHRGLDKLDVEASRSTMIARLLAGGVHVTRIQLIADDAWAVLADRHAGEYLYGLKHALWLQANGYWGPDILEETMRRFFTVDAPTQAQQMAYLRRTLRAAEVQIPPADLSAYRQAAETLAQKVESGQLWMANGAGHAIGFGQSAQTAQSKTFRFRQSNTWGLDPEIGVERPHHWGPIWQRVPVFPTCGGCTEGRFDDVTYRHCAEAVDYATAEERCGGSLATVPGLDHQAFVRSLAPSFQPWIGLNDREQEGVFVWADDTPVHDVLWAPGEPNDWGEDEDCAHAADYGLRSRWNDRACTGLRDFICRVP